MKRWSKGTITFYKNNYPGGIWALLVISDRDNTGK